MRVGESVAAGVVANNPMARIPSPAISATENRKQKTYALMVDLGAIQARKRRLRAPEFFPAVVSHAGELSPGMIKLIEVLTREASLQYSPGPLTMGMSRKRHTGAFRTRLEDAVMAANAAGFGRALAAAGNPMGGGCRICPSDLDDLEAPSWDVVY